MCGPEPLLEREDALELLVAEAARARTGTGRPVLLRGATGTGRTALLEAAAEHAAAEGMRVLRARCSPEHTAVPFDTVFQLLAHGPEFDAVAEEAPDAPGTPPHRGRFARLWRLLCSYAAEAPLMVAVDDVHFADVCSRRWLVETVRRIDRLPVLLVMTERSQYDIDPPADGLTHALSPSLVHTLTLAPLGPDSMAELVRHARGGSAPADWVDECVRASAGSPLLLRALLEDLRNTDTEGLAHADAGALPDTCAALYPGAYPAAVSWWLDSAGPATTEVARALAALEDGGGWGDGAGWGDGLGSDARGGAAGRGEGDARGGASSRGDRGVGDVRRGAPGRGDGDAGGGVGSGGDEAGGDAGRGAAGRGDRAGGGARRGAVGRGDRTGGDTWGGASSRGDRGVGDARRGAAGLRERGGVDARRGVTVWGGRIGGPTRRGAVGRGDRTGGLVADAALLARTADADPARVTGWLTAMTRLGLLRPDPDGRPRYAHPLLRDAILGGWPAARRQAAHQRAAEAMRHRGDGAEAVAGQLLRSAPVDRAWATGVLLDAADLAVRDDRGEDAVAFLRRALDEPMSPGRRTVVLTELGSLEYATVRSTAGIQRLTEALKLPGPPQDRVRAAVALGTVLARRGEARVAIDVLRDLQDEHLTGHPDLVRTVHTASALLSDHDQGVRQDMYRWLRETAERSPALVGTAGQALLVRYESTAGLTSAESAMRRVRALLAEPAEPLSEAFLLGTAAAVAQWADQLDEAERLVCRGLAGQRASLLHPMHQALLNVRLDIATARGAYAELTELPELAELLADSGASGPTEGGSESANARAHAIIALVETGRTEEATRLADDFDLQHTHDCWEVNRFLYARGVLRAATDDPAGALDDFLECGRRQTARDVLSPVVTPWRAASAECHLTLGRPGEALALAEEELHLATVWHTPRVLGRALRVLAMATGGRRGLELAERAVRMLREGTEGAAGPAEGDGAGEETPDGRAAVAPGTEPAETELIPALIAQGRLLTAAGERTRARDALREAAERAERLGAVRMRSMAEEALREGGARRTATAMTGPESLTDAERRIAALAAQGRTNTEIAGLLHLARRTVETHLTSAYRKLGIRRRSQLPTALTPGAAQPSS
ncbi:helix-turn-helix transcriptional regulator [Streptomyces ipomoeae]|uniref:Transcriptional regulator, LuxR family n=1 Tax=Streptomyces ipomoeae 91-03 TaxID=698759 RepID=L1KNX4_9ACTN|nr:LuxR family transcriptional regulator [Streptomyces ipomoeae]EKX62093.1 transcriptional regulator, LuxR family [Streptomyces ipomoeae 91-03]